MLQGSAHQRARGLEATDQFENNIHLRIPGDFEGINGDIDVFQKRVVEFGRIPDRGPDEPNGPPGATGQSVAMIDENLGDARTNGAKPNQTNPQAVHFAACQNHAKTADAW